ncbi:MAG: hypothetical protein KBC90_05330 [Spirochaetes bacterium]|nr:hypothetical protein [Spirochaetota bacterium]
MKKIFIKAVIFICIPIFMNIGFTVYCFHNRSISEFKGYFLGTMLSMFFSLVWIFIARKAVTSNIMVMFTVTLASFPVKIIVLAIFALGGLFFLDMNQVFFGGSFLLGTILSLFVEVWFLITANRFQRKLRSDMKATEIK